MKKRKINVGLAVGVTLVLVALALMLTLQIRMYAGQRYSRDVVAQMEEVLPERAPGIPGLYPGGSLPALELEGRDFVALLEIPMMGVKLPVAAQWDGIRLAYSPARYFGGPGGDDLVIGGTDYPGQFAFCDKIENGTAVVITDMTGTQYRYSVIRVDRSDRAPAQWLISDEYGLTLFCRDLYTMEYIAVRCGAVAG